MMQKLIFILTMFVVTVVLSGCYTKEDDDSVHDALPVCFQKIGKAFAKEIRQTVGNLNRMELKYAQIKKTADLRSQFYKDYLEASSVIIRSRSITNLDQLLKADPEVFSARYNNLTVVQLDFIKRILREADNSISCWNFLDRLEEINQEILANVPKIEQERLFLVTTFLYYGLKEIYTLEQNGLMPVAFNSEVYLSNITTKMPDEGYIDGQWCRKVLSTVWLVALEEPTFIGETIASVATVVIGGVLLYEYLVCKRIDPDTQSNENTYKMCQNYYYNCTESPRNLRCDDCLQFCLVQGMWPDEMCSGIMGGNAQ